MSTCSHFVRRPSSVRRNTSGRTRALASLSGRSPPFRLPRHRSTVVPTGAGVARDAVAHEPNQLAAPMLARRRACITRLVGRRSTYPNPARHGGEHAVAHCKTHPGLSRNSLAAREPGNRLPHRRECLATRRSHRQEWYNKALCARGQRGGASVNLRGPGHLRLY